MLRVGQNLEQRQLVSPEQALGFYYDFLIYLKVDKDLALSKLSVIQDKAIIEITRNKTEKHPIYS